MGRQLDLPMLTERLVIRALSLEDFDRHFEMYSNEMIVRYLYYGVMDGAAARAHLARRSVAELPFEGSFMNLGVEVRGEGVLIGEVALGQVSTANRVCEVGYVFDPRWSGHGYATEATAVMVDLAFDQLGAHRVIGRLDARNTASAPGPRTPRHASRGPLSRTRPSRASGPTKSSTPRSSTSGDVGAVREREYRRAPAITVASQRGDLR